MTSAGGPSVPPPRKAFCVCGIYPSGPEREIDPASAWRHSGYCAHSGAPSRAPAPAPPADEPDPRKVRAELEAIRLRLARLRSLEHLRELCAFVRELEVTRVQLRSIVYIDAGDMDRAEGAIRRVGARVVGELLDACDVFAPPPGPAVADTAATEPAPAGDVAGDAQMQADLAAVFPSEPDPHV